MLSEGERIRVNVDRAKPKHYAMRANGGNHWRLDGAIDRIHIVTVVCIASVVTIETIEACPKAVIAFLGRLIASVWILRRADRETLAFRHPAFGTKARHTCIMHDDRCIVKD